MINDQGIELEIIIFSREERDFSTSFQKENKHFDRKHGTVQSLDNCKVLGLETRGRGIPFIQPSNHG